jgi:hypothetical protein
MKQLIIIGMMMTQFIVLTAQREYLPTKEDLEHFFKTKTLVVMEESPMSEFNIEIQGTMSREWKITGFEFIRNADFKEKSQSENYSFIYTSQVTFEKDKTEARYVFLHLSLGGENLTMDDLRDLVSVPLGYYGVDPDKYMYKIGILVRFMQNHINFIYKNPEMITDNVFRHYNDNIKSAHDKILYILPDELSKDVSTEARIKSVYSHKFKISTPEEIEQAIDEVDKNVIFLHKVGPGGKKNNARCYKIIIGAGDANFYYFDYHRINEKNPDGFLKSDFVKLNK